MAARIRKGDTVQVMTGKSRGVRGVVMSIQPKDGRVTVSGANKVWKHLKPNAPGSQGRGGRIERENPLHISNVMLVHKDEPTRVGFKIVNGKKVRWSRRHDEAIDA